jgi:hypothetical protein
LIFVHGCLHAERAGRKTAAPDRSLNELGPEIRQASVLNVSAPVLVVIAGISRPLCFVFVHRPVPFALRGH